MGFFSKFFYTPPSKDKWSEIALNISKNVDEIGNLWFNEIVQSLEENSLEVKNTELIGEGEHVIKAYLLFLGTTCIASNEYIARADGKDFSDILFAYICGNQIEEVLEFFGRYVGANDGNPITPFSIDLSSYILEEKSPLALLSIAPKTIKLGLMLNMCIASHFGDESTASDYALKLKNFD